MNFKKSVKLGEIRKQALYVRPLAFVSAAIMWILFTLLGLKFLQWRPGKALAGGFLATFLHFFGEWWHQMGHARAAEQTGFPMKGMLFWGPLATSKYPADEGLLTPETHIQRAIGGPIFSFILAAVSGLIALILRPLGGMAYILALFTAADSFFVFTIGALTPLGFNDGSTILEWWGKNHRSQRIRIDGD